MPRNSGLGVAAGLAQGVDAFTRSFVQARQMKNQEKLQKNMVVVDLLLNQLRDPNVSYYERAKAIDAIPGLIGAKLDRPLTSVLGYDKLNEEDFILEQGQKEISSKQGTLPQTIVDESVTDPQMASSITTRGTEATQTIPEVAPVTTKRGNLSPAQIKLQQDLEAQRLANRNDVDKQAAILRINYQLQSEILGKNGYTNEVFRGYNADGDYIVTYANAQGQKKEINLGKVQSETLKKAMITSQSKSGGGKLGQLILAQNLVASFENNPGSVPQPTYLAAKSLLDDFEKTGQVKDAQVVAMTQGATGTRPLSPAQETNNFQEDQRTLLSLQNAFDTIDSEYIASQENTQITTAEATNFWNSVVEPIKAAMQEWLDNGGEKTDREYVDLNRQLNIQTSQYNMLKARGNAAGVREKALKSKRDAAEKRLKSFKPSTGAATSLSGTSIDDEVQQYKNLIDAFRTTPANADKVKDLSDRQILKILKDAKRIP